MIDRHNFFDQPVRNDSITYNILKNGAGQGDDYTTGSLLDYNYFKRYYEMIVIDLSKQQALDADSKAIQQINFTETLDRGAGSLMFFVVEEAKKTFQIFWMEL